MEEMLHVLRRETHVALRGAIVFCSVEPVLGMQVGDVAEVVAQLSQQTMAQTLSWSIYMRWDAFRDQCRFILYI